MTVYDASAWTGRYPVARGGQFPRFRLHLAMPWFSLTVGPLVYHDAFGVSLALGEVRNPALGEHHYRWDRTWIWFTAEQWMESHA